MHTLESAIRLTPGERQAVVEAFFSRFPGPGRQSPGLGRAIRDFQAWEVASGRIPGSAWWQAVNGRMVLDIAMALEAPSRVTRAVDAWLAYAAAGDDAQALLWEAHQYSLHAGVRDAADLLGIEPGPEQEFAAIVIDVVDRTALAGSPTDTAGLAELTSRFYPTVYPIDAVLLPALRRMRDRTAERLATAAGEPFADVGLDSRRWTL